MKASKVKRERKKSKERIKKERKKERKYTISYIPVDYWLFRCDPSVPFPDVPPVETSPVPSI